MDGVYPGTMVPGYHGGVVQYPYPPRWQHTGVFSARKARTSRRCHRSNNNNIILYFPSGLRFKETSTFLSWGPSPKKERWKVSSPDTRREI